MHYSETSLLRSPSEQGQSYLSKEGTILMRLISYNLEIIINGSNKALILAIHDFQNIKKKWWM